MRNIRDIRTTNPLNALQQQQNKQIHLLLLVFHLLLFKKKIKKNLLATRQNQFYNKQRRKEIKCDKVIQIKYTHEYNNNISEKSDFKF